MTPIEIMAVIFAVLVLVKLIIIAINPKKWAGFANSIFKQGEIAIIVYLLLAAVVGYYLIQSLTIVEIASVMLFTSLLIGVGWMPYSKTLQGMIKELLKEDILKKNWLSVTIWVWLALWVLYAVFM